MFTRLLRRIVSSGRVALQALNRCLVAVTRPAAPTLIAGALADLTRSKPQLVAENALLRQQLLVLRRSVTRPRCTPADRAIFVLLAGRVRAWRQALLIVQPDTLLRWHRDLFRRHWRRKSRAKSMARRAGVSAETITLIREMAVANRLWGAERIRGELLKLDIRVAKWTVQKYMRGARPLRRNGQTWATFLQNHAAEIWACDFLPVTDLLFRPLDAFVVIALGSRRVIHVGVTRHPNGVASPSSCARPRRSTSARGTSSATATASMVRPSRASPRRPASRNCARPTARPGRTGPASGSSGACGARASTMSWCWARPTCDVCCASTWPTSTLRGHTKGCCSRSPTQQRCAGFDRRTGGWCGPCRCLAGYITRTDERRETRPRADG